jgi:hypothetical protein
MPKRLKTRKPYPPPPFVVAPLSPGRKGIGLFLSLSLLNFAAAQDLPSQTKDPKVSSPGIAHKELIPVLIEAVKDRDEDDTVRGNAAQALVNLGRQAMPSLLVLLECKNNDLRIKAATILANMRPGEAQEALPILFKALQNKKADRDFRHQATFAISQIVALPNQPPSALFLAASPFGGLAFSAPVAPQQETSTMKQRAA